MNKLTSKINSKSKPRILYDISLCTKVYLVINKSEFEIWIFGIATITIGYFLVW